MVLLVEHILNVETLNSQHGGHRKHDTVKEIVPIQDYLFRYDRGTFWTGRHVFTYFGLRFVHISHWLFDPLSRAKVLYYAP